MKFSFLGLTLVAVLFLGWTLSFESHVLAHSTGISLEKTVGEYKFDIGYNPPVLEAMDPTSFDFNLLLNKTGERVEFSDIWIRVVKGKKTVFASGIHKPSFGNTTMLYAFPQGGEYELMVRFQNQGEKLAEVSFPLVVEEAGGGTSLPNILLLWLMAGVLGGGVIGFFVSRAVGSKRKEGQE